MNNIITTAALALALTGCAVTPRIVAQTPAMAVVESPPNVERATALAQDHCRAGGRDAVLRQTTPVTRAAMHYSYECVWPEPPPPPAPAAQPRRRHRRAVR